MKKALTFLLIFSLMFWPQRQSTAQNDSTNTKKDVINLDKKDSTLSVKIDSQIVVAKQLVKRIENKKPVVKFRTRIKTHVRTDSFYVYIDTCFGKTNVIQTAIPDTVWMERNRPRLKEFIQGIFGHKPERKDEIKVIEPTNKHTNEKDH